MEARAGIMRGRFDFRGQEKDQRKKIYTANTEVAEGTEKKGQRRKDREERTEKKGQRRKDREERTEKKGQRRKDREERRGTEIQPDGRGKTRRLPSPWSSPARERPSGVMAKSRKVRP